MSLPMQYTDQIPIPEQEMVRMIEVTEQLEDEDYLTELGSYNIDVGIEKTPHGWLSHVVIEFEKVSIKPEKIVEIRQLDALEESDQVKLRKGNLKISVLEEAGTDE